MRPLWDMSRGPSPLLPALGLMSIGAFVLVHGIRLAVLAVGSLVKGALWLLRLAACLPTKLFCRHGDHGSPERRSTPVVAASAPSRIADAATPINDDLVQHRPQWAQR